MTGPGAGPLPVVVLISGRGSNLQALLDEAQRGTLPVEIRAVISNRPQAPGLERARRAGVATEVVDPRALGAPGAPAEDFDTALRDAIDRHQPGLVALAGFMRILSPEFVAHYQGRILNIHPSLLPAFRGLDTHRRALEAGAREHGASVHFVTAELDNGPVVIQARVPVLPGDDAGRLAARVLEQEHRIYPLAVRWFAEGRLHLDERGVWLDGRRLEQPVSLAEGTAAPA